MAGKMIRLRKKQEAYLNKISEDLPDALDVVIDGHRESVLMKKMLKITESESEDKINE